MSTVVDFIIVEVDQVDDNKNVEEVEDENPMIWIVKNNESKGAKKVNIIVT